MTNKVSIIIISIIAWCFVTADAQTGTCFLGGHRYNVGETWHPKLIPIGENTCVNCTCLAGEEVNCVGVDCPRPECDEPKLKEGQCCADCDAAKEEVQSVAIETPGCKFHGEKYENGDGFPSNKTALKPNFDNQCVLCTCIRGEVICHLKTCLSSLGCRKIVRVDDDCCPHCEDEITSEIGNHTLEDGDCLSATGRHKNASTWKPVIGSLGTVDCIVCTCSSGLVTCERLQCPDENTLQCKKPKLEPGGCCKHCPEHSTARKKERKTNSTPEQNSPGHKQENGQPIFTNEMSLNNVIPRLCLPDKVEGFVYRRRGDHFDSMVYDSPKDNTVEHFYWMIKKGQIQPIEQKVILDLDIFRKSFTIADLLGAVKKKDIKKFMKKLNKRQKQCKKKCRRKILDRTIKKIRMKEINLNKACHS